jgi:hypothetical protein
MHTLALFPNFIESHLGWWLFGLSILLGVAVGISDLARLSVKRIWAISGVCFDESIRRRVLWITPLAILGVIIVSQLQRPLDEQDAIRQTIKFCIFATGLLVALTTIILACTNLPREIENRVIYTVVTKPTTRLEIVLGKVVGFARVSLTILLIMGLFSYVYLSARAWTMRRAIAQRLEAREVAATSIASLTYYRDAGLLNAKTLEEPDQLQVFGRIPEAGDTRRYFFGGQEGSFIVPFDLTPEMITPPGGSEPGENGLVVIARVGYVRKGAATAPAATQSAATQSTAATTGPTSKPYYGPFIMSPEERAAIMAGTKPSGNPQIAINVEDANFNNLGLTIPFGIAKSLELTDKNGLTTVPAMIEPKTARGLKGRVNIRVVGVSPDTEYYIDLKENPPPAVMMLPMGDKPPITIRPAASPIDPAQLALPVMQSRQGTAGFSVRGGTDKAPTAVYQFRSANVVPDNDDKAPFEFRSAIERSNADEIAASGNDQPTEVSVRVRNLATGVISPEIMVEPESNRTIFFRVPAADVAGGNFDVLMHCQTKDDFLQLTNHSLVLITSSQPFWLNLAKSLAILWLMTVLVTAVAIFCSTFLSWPIAVVLTIVILLGHWGVEQLGDSTQPGIGNQVVTDFGLRSPAKAEAVRATVEKLSSFLNFISTVLPDISQYSAVEDIERGVAIPGARLGDALLVTLGFGLPLVLLAYVFLKNKEVAP